MCRRFGWIYSLRLKKMKQVRFSTCTYFYFKETQEEIEYKKSYWIQVAADRYRFEKRIESLESIIGKILDPVHRNYMYNKLYCTFGCGK